MFLTIKAISLLSYGRKQPQLGRGNTVPFLPLIKVEAAVIPSRLTLGELLTGVQANIVFVASKLTVQPFLHFVLIQLQQIGRSLLSPSILPICPPMLMALPRVLLLVPLSCSMAGLTF